MKNGMRSVLAFLAITVMAVQTVAADEALFKSSVIGSRPGLVIAGVPSGGAPWVVKQGTARLDSNGRLRVEVEGLVIAPDGPPAVRGTTAGVKSVFASVVCGGSGGTLAASTAPVPLSPTGDAEIEATVALPSSCFAPSVLVRISRAGLPPWIAATGFTSGSGEQEERE